MHSWDVESVAVRARLECLPRFRAFWRGVARHKNVVRSQAGGVVVRGD